MLPANTSHKSHVTRKQRQSYLHADPHRQQQHTAIDARVTSNCATVMVLVTVWLCPLTFWPLAQCMRATTTEYMCTEFGVNSSSLFPFRVWTNRQTQLNALPRTLFKALCYGRWVIFIVNSCLPHYVHMQCTTFTPEPEVRWPGQYDQWCHCWQCPPSDASMKTSIVLVRYARMQDTLSIFGQWCTALMPLFDHLHAVVMTKLRL